jgi:hypothetical protein
MLLDRGPWSILLPSGEQERLDIETPGSVVSLQTFSEKNAYAA